MPYFIYLMTDSDRRNIHAGYCNDLQGTLDFYNIMPSMAMDENYKQNVLVYLEQGEYEHQVQERLKQVAALNYKQKEALVNAINPTWMELKPGVNIEL